MKMAALISTRVDAFIFELNGIAARTVEPQLYRGAERAAEVTLLTKKPAPTCRGPVSLNVSF
jgi:hypothetical protein